LDFQQADDYVQARLHTLLSHQELLSPPARSLLL
jgi:hypothetical protein